MSNNGVVQMRYANNSNYKNDTMIRKEVHVTKAIIDELRRILEDSEVGSAIQVLAVCPHPCSRSTTLTASLELSVVLLGDRCTVSWTCR